ncbi:MAG: POTRA domain-containing protein [Cyanobacteria bacterium J06636_28]
MHQSNYLLRGPIIFEGRMLLGHWFISVVGVLCLLGTADKTWAQTTAPLELPPSQDTVLPQDEPLPEPLPPQELPPADDLLEPSQEPLSQPSLPINDATFRIDRFEFINSTVFDDAKLQEVTDEFKGTSQTFADIAAARAAVTQLYIDSGYPTSGAAAISANV